MKPQGYIPNIPSGCSFFSLEGNIGSGKSTFLHKLAQTDIARIIYEPHMLWQNVCGHNLLDAFYKDAQRWAYSFQTYVFLTRMKAVEEAIQADGVHPACVYVAERSVYADRLCFGQACFEGGFISPLEWNMYCSWYDWLVGQYMHAPRGIIYLQVSPEKSRERINKRKRTEEETIDFAYLTRLHELHENFLVHRKNVPSFIRNIPVLVLDGNVEFESCQQKWEVYLQQIQRFIAEHQLYSSITPPQLQTSTASSSYA